VLAFGAGAAVVIRDLAGSSRRHGVVGVHERGAARSGNPDSEGRTGSGGTRAKRPTVTVSTRHHPGRSRSSRFALLPVTGPLPIRYRFKHPPVAGILFDVRSGAVLWQRNPRLKHPDRQPDQDDDGADRR